ncbi:carbon-nitrogen hydrolase family protein [Nitrosophilus alvini]|uniref:carbon-nitrogen hydrolase family protein n=1 Tax=Nitrosophilus alvini TaxID=2714855 RepID=UPI00190A4A06|nr:carbon-nitrogen hydrolase family protein [Nitrosophilus alvini]
MNIAALQLSSLGMSPNKLDYYLRICRSKNVRVLLLGEYVLNRFFKELESTPISMIKEQSSHQTKTLKSLAKTYGITIVAPIVTVSKEKPYKSIAIFSPSKTHYYQQQFLIDYKHWNEEKFFANEIKEVTAPPVFVIDGVKFGVLAGYELHFNIFWDIFMKKNVDVVLLPTVSTFDSNERWMEIIKTRAFLGSTYILRANRIGEYIHEGVKWNFYGESFCVNPYGKIEAILSDKEELLICSVSKELSKEMRRAWGFKNSLQKRKVL